jgi:O-antigen/teichoic acid export membrane protein
LGICVYLDMSFWALVLNHVLSGILIVLLLFYLRSHALSWPSKLSEITGSLKFGLKILISRIAWYGYSNADQVILGRIAGADSLGAFNFAMTFARIPVDEISSLSGKVVPGVFSSIQHSPAKLSRYVLLLTEATSYLTIPATIGIALVAGDFVPLAIGPQWQAVVLPLQILGIHACILSVTTLWSHVYIWTGNIRINMYLSLLSLVVLPPVFYFGARYGAVGVALGWTIMAPIMLIPGFLFLKRILKMRFSTFMNCLGPALISTALMCLAIAIARYAVFSELSQVLRFVGDAAIGAATYFTVLIVFFRRRVQRIVQTVRRSI